MTRRRTVVRTGAALALATTVVLTGLVLARDSDSVAVQVTTGAGQSPPMVPSFVPPGLGLAAVLDLPLAGRRVPQASLLLYGEPGAADPFADGDLAVFTTKVEGDEPTFGGAEEPVVVRGRPGAFTSAFAPADLGLKAVRWLDGDALFLQVVSRALSKEELLAATEALDVAPAGPVAARRLPRDLRLVARQAAASVPALLAPIPTGAAGHIVSYTSASSGPDPQRHVVVGSHPGGAEVLVVLRWFYGPNTRPQAVALHAGRLATLAGSRSETCAVGVAGPMAPPPRCQTTLSEAYVLAWTTAAGMVVMESSGVTRSDLLATAASVEAVDDAAWQQLKAAAAAQDGQEEGESSGAGTAGPATTRPPPP